MSKGKSKVGSVCLIIGALLLLSCVCWYLHLSHESNKAGEIAYQKLEAVKLYIDKEAHSSVMTTELLMTEDTEPFIRELSVVNIDGCPYIGYLTIPSQELEMPVADTWDDEILKTSLCRYYGSPFTDDLVIAGHNYKSSFGKLKNLAIGDEVSFTDMNGEVIL